MKHLVRALLVTAAVVIATAQAQVQLTYWQYEFNTRVQAMSQLIDQFNAANPDIIVVQETFPYDAYQERVAAALAAGQGPDVVQLFYGWAANWQRRGYVEPHNKDMMADAGLDPEAPPTTWDEFVAAAKAMTVKRGPLYTQIGYGFGGQDHHLIRTVLMNQLGSAPYSADSTEVLYGNDIGAQALKTWTDWILVDEIGEIEFVPGTSGYREGFHTQQTIGMMIDGSFAIGQVQNNAQFEWGVTELPTFANGTQANFGSFWMNGVTANAYESEAKLEAAARFIEFVTSPEAMQLWLDVVGELPAAADLVADPALQADPVFGAFIAGLAYAEATQFVDEGKQRQVILDAYNRVVLEGMDPAESIMIAAAEDQALLDEFNAQ